MSTPAGPTPGSPEHEKLMAYIKLEWMMSQHAANRAKAANGDNQVLYDWYGRCMAADMNEFNTKWGVAVTLATFDNDRIGGMMRVITDELTEEERHERGQSHAGAVQFMAGLVYAEDSGQPMDDPWEPISDAHFAKWGERITPHDDEVLDMAADLAVLASNNAEE